MTALLDELFLTPEEFLEWEEANGAKHEYLNGYVLAMAGAGRAHNSITTAILGQLERQLAERPCEPFGSDMRLLIQHATRTFYYFPDAMVDCSGSAKDEVEEPTVIFEVASPSTGRADHGDKLLNYLSLPSLKVYVIVDQARVLLVVYRRDAEGNWLKEILRNQEQTLLLPEIGCSIPVATIYQRVKFASSR